MPPIPPARARAIRTAILAWWDAGHRELPWRFAPGSADPYRVWISEVMLQQTQVAAVVPYYQRFLRRFPTLRALALASEDDVVAAWSGLGYYGRARRLHEAARIALERHGALPATLDALRELPGFGAYTSAAVASIAFGIAAAAVDGNVARVLSRMFLVEDAPESRAFRERVATLAGALLPADRAGDWNQALMDLGATVCVKPAPRCDRCPVRRACEARRVGRERDVPRARPRAAQRRVVLACAIVRRRGAVLLARRPPGSLFAGTWGPPSFEASTEAEALGGMTDALAREGIQVLAQQEAGRVERALTHRRVLLVGIGCRVLSPPPIGVALRWVTPDAARQVGMSTAVERLLSSCLGWLALTREGVSV